MKMVFISKSFGKRINSIIEDMKILLYKYLHIEKM